MLMPMTVTPRNTATHTNTGTATSLALAFTVTSTVAGDVGVVVIVANVTASGGGSPTATFSVPSGWVIAAGPSVVHVSGGVVSGMVTAVYVNPNLAAGTTSFTFTATISGGSGTREVAIIQGCYAAFTGGKSSLSTEGAAFASATTSSSTLPSVTTSAVATSADLVIWGGTEGNTTAVSVGTPTGFTSVVNLPGTTSTAAVRMAAAIATPGSTATASGATSTSGLAAYAAIIVGLTNLAADGFFALGSR